MSTKQARQIPHRLGAHLSIAGGLPNALRRARQLRLQTLQVFVKNQRQWRGPSWRPGELRTWHQLRIESGLHPVVAHASYLINLASDDPELYERSLHAFAWELHRCHELGIAYLVVHPGSAGRQPRAAALERVAAALNRILAKRPQITTRPLLETTAGQGSSLGCDFAELGTIIGRLQQPARVGVCVDTCHVFAAGYDLRTQAGYQALITAARRTVGLKRIRCWHLNDSRSACGSRVDRHEHIGRGHIGLRGFRNLLADRRFRGLPMIIETPKGTDGRGRDWDRINLARLRRLAREAGAPDVRAR